MTAEKSEKGGSMVLPLTTQFAYSVGHVLNDLCASMWFSYLLLFMTLVLGLSSEVAGALALVGQIADGVATPIVGFCSDRGSVFFCCNYGRRKSWHLLGTICVVTSFPFIFSQCFGCEKSEVWAKALYYGTFITIFQFGWASVQIANLAVVPELTPDEHERTLLFSYRYSFTVISSMAVYIMTWIALRVSKDDINEKIGPSDKNSFQYVMIAVIGIGTVASIFYHLGVPEGNREDNLVTTDESPQIHPKSSAINLFKDIHLYKIGVVYMVTRLFVNMSQVLIPLYLQYHLKLPAESIASVPLTVFIVSFATSLVIKPLNKRLGRRIAFSIGCLIGLGASVWVYFGKGDLYKTYLVNAVAALFGCGGSIMLVTSLSITADHIGVDFDNGAFIYGIMSFLDKISNGVAIMIVQSMGCVTCSTHYRDSLIVVCGVSSIVGILGVMTFRKQPAQRGEYTAKENQGFENDESAEIENGNPSISEDPNNISTLPSTIVVTVPEVNHGFSNNSIEEHNKSPENNSHHPS